MAKWTRWIEYNNAIDEYRGQVIGDFGDNYVYPSTVLQSSNKYRLVRRLNKAQRWLTKAYQQDVRTEFIADQWRNEITTEWTTND